jgi:hypothetical protein
MQTANKTIYGIRDDTERAGLILWSLVVLTASLIGDSVILLATFKYKAFKQHKVIISVAQHLAVCDLLQVVFRVIPVTLALITDRWVMGVLFCHIQDNVGFVWGMATQLLTCTLSTLKLITVKYPIKTRPWSSRLGHVICTAVWVLVMILYCPVLLVKMHYIRDTIHFSYIDYECNYGQNLTNVPAWYRQYSLVSIPVFTALAYAILIATSIALLVVAKKSASKHNTTLRWEGVIAVLLTVAILLISYLPFSVIFVIWFMGVEISISSTAWRAVCYIQYVNIAANFFVYYLVIQSFREFLHKRLSVLGSALRSTGHSQATPERTYPQEKVKR